MTKKPARKSKKAKRGPKEERLRITEDPRSALGELFRKTKG